ncbi:MAG TPA: hypothetical protein VGR90_02180 [Acidimicrobiales bacterium]|nr:hypothetical protein [Acidimicrobiales bacterium]
MITPYDDFPIHQTSEPVAQPVSADPNHYDRYFFNGYATDGSVFFGAAMGHYPNRGVIDAAFSVVHDGVEHSVFASGAMPLDRATEIGPVRVEVLEPLRTLRVSVAPNEHGIEADLVFAARTPVVEEPRNTAVRGTRRVMDNTRLTQWGSWSGRIGVDGSEVVGVGAGGPPLLGVRDRSWGQRPVGAQPPNNFPPELPQLFWMWAPLNFESFCTHLALFEHADGQRWLEQALVVPVLLAGAPTWGPDTAVEHLAGVDYEISWHPGTRVAARTVLRARHTDGSVDTITLEPLFTFRMRGIGYSHPEWGHGSVHGPLAVGGESIKLDDFRSDDPSSLHVQSLVRARLVHSDGSTEDGVGVLEQAAFGEHHPTGLTGLIDGWRS